MEARTASVSVATESPASKVPDVVQAQQQQQQQLQLQQRQKLKQPGVSYRATLQKLSNTISLSSAEILERYEKSEPSLTLHFYRNHWKFDNQDGVFLYNSPARQILEAIRNEQIPVDCLEVFRDVKVRYYEGCLILRLVDNREEPPTIMHTALRPTPESIWTEMLLYSEQTQGNFTDAKALQVESDILVATNPPLDLRPSLHPAYSASLLYDIKDRPLPKLKRKRYSLHEDDEEERLMYLYDERHGKEFAPDFKRLAFVEAHRKKKQLQIQRNAASAAEANKATPNNPLRKTAQSPIVMQQQAQSSPQTPSIPASNVSGTANHLPDRSSVPPHLQSRPSASPQPGPRQLLNQQALAQHIAQQNQALQNGGSPRLPNHLPAGAAHGTMVNDLARQQQIMLQQRAIAIRNINAARAAQAQGVQGQSPRLNANGQLQATQLGVTQGTPTPLQMQQIRQMQAQQQHQQMLAAQQQAAQNAHQQARQ
ncbi:protein of unknown function [Taphrina deformans PYCC 5710]|uniref:Spt20-like SEP domain-containing protein n=1 Tax=Taphrina deformans (strain PYCC 5710 / ATCC 11124 / CBS 356.35 / IMI 108563 / JCM 9778 / NBRC 8474) TaxID=1097556 RepID=R4XLZ4_TAPDE|nr:protein of unknown function [Taphrina deformans PYCC 5710]|eukprot:CCG84315.1 protein of unknown function [Taphrina deformans PYCC 5710]